MNVTKVTCALFHRKQSRREIAFWRQAELWVKKLQMRIAKAVSVGRRGKVKALQWILTHSFYARLLAVRRILANKGRKTPGIDGVTWKTPQQKMQAVHSLRRRGYRPQPLRRVYIHKRNGKLRPLGIPTMRDRAMQALYALALLPVAETTADSHSYGFRLKRCCADAIGQCFIALSRWYSPKWILEADIRGCFDNISHQWMLENIPMDRQILKAWLEAGYMDKGAFHKTHKGTPQGGVISPVLANMTLDGLEDLLFGDMRPDAGGRRKFKCNVVRYADDFIMTGSSLAFLRDRVKPAVEAFLAERGLALSQEKTRITHVEDGFEFLGQHIKKTRGTLQINPTRDSVRSVIRKCKRIIKSHGADNASLIGKLNPVLRGWANYHRHVYASDTFSQVDNRIFPLIWNWLKRRCRKKGKRWRARENYCVHNGVRWTFFGKRRTSSGKVKKVHLLRTASIRTSPYAKIRADANPYDPSWESYFAKRAKAGRLRVSERRLKDAPTLCGI
jgi:RNA-directed DNA polymerase